MKILTLREEGFSQREVAEKLQESKSGVQKIIKKYSKTGEVANLPGRGRKTYTSAREKKHIVLLSKSNRKLTAPEIKEDINSTREDPI